MRGERVTHQSFNETFRSDAERAPRPAPGMDVLSESEFKVTIDLEGRIKFRQTEKPTSEQSISEILKDYQFRQERPFEAERERKVIETLIERYGFQRAREIAEYRLMLQLHGLFSEALGRPTHRQDGVLRHGNGACEVLGVGDEHLGDVRELTERAGEEFSGDPRIQADRHGWNGIYDGLIDAPNGAGALLISPGSEADYSEADVLYLFQVGEGPSDSPYDRVIQKTTVLVLRQPLGAYKNVGRYLQTRADSLPVPETLARERSARGLDDPDAVDEHAPWNFLYQPFFVREAGSIDRLYEQVISAGDIAGSDVPTPEQLAHLSEERLDRIVDVESGRVVNLEALSKHVTDMLFKGAGDHAVEAFVDKHLLTAVGDQYEARGLGRPTELNLACGKISSEGEEMMEERERNGKTEYRCLECNNWSQFPNGTCHGCGYQISCARGESGGANYPDEDPTFLSAVLRRVNETTIIPLE